MHYLFCATEYFPAAYLLFIPVNEKRDSELSRLLFLQLGERKLT